MIRLCLERPRLVQIAKVKRRRIAFNLKCSRTGIRNQLNLDLKRIREGREICERNLVEGGDVFAVQQVFCMKLRVARIISVIVMVVIIVVVLIAVVFILMIVVIVVIIMGTFAFQFGLRLNNATVGRVRKHKQIQGLGQDQQCVFDRCAVFCAFGGVFKPDNIRPRCVEFHCDLRSVKRDIELADPMFMAARLPRFFGKDGRDCEGCEGEKRQEFNRRVPVFGFGVTG